ncbi:hypothetical protein KBB96_12335 [Luteolibacter ambystomatis]|uniref:DUF2939 domain-containing protein n=1 Tax=Luteolibacter ambystomatis TaxID=2824561 RepID=A0A975G5V6_9BACT|nr:hypothetical protein [Luteolibacter ambystomatis]QUE49659.1 hypothetical protein KBB96_12335 [Luteolibacter ambystomatis]
MTAASLRAQNPAPAPAAPAPGENVVKADPVPADLGASAKAAVEKLCTEVVAGRYQIAIDRMYPQWKERMAKRAGGMENLNAQLAQAPILLQKNGVTLLSSKPEGAPQIFQVAPGKRIEKVGGSDVAVMGYTKWLVIVPTVTRFKISKTGASTMAESTSFQVAVSDKGKYDWTFIDGSSATLADLRSLFFSLPVDLQLPKIGGGEIGGERK